MKFLYSLFPGIKAAGKKLALLFTALVILLHVQAQNQLNKVGLGTSAYSSVAYSLRLLSSTYTGKAINVRRSSDNTTQDIGFTANGDFDTAALKIFVGGNSGYVTIWYDQSGSGIIAMQTIEAYQPRIVNAGVIERVNQKPAVYFGTTYLATPSVSLFSSAASMVGFAKGNSASSSAFVTKTSRASGGLGGLGTYVASPFDYTDINGKFSFGSNNAFGQSQQSFYLGQGAPRSDVSSAVAASVYAFTMSFPGACANYLNGALANSQTITGYGDDGQPMVIGNNNDNSGSGNFWTPEIVLFNSVLSTANRNAVEASETAYFNNVDAKLTGLSLSSVPLTPNFTSNTLGYTSIVNNTLPSTTVSATLSDAGASMQLSVNGGVTIPLANGASVPVALNQGDNVIKILVTAKNGGVTNAYTVTVKKQNVVPEVTGAAVAYSLRLVKSTYTGKAINVRRSGDNTTQDIGFTAQGDLDTTALKAFVGSGNGYVAAWYDQSGNGFDATRNFADNQPIIVNAGALVMLNGRPAMYFHPSAFLVSPPATMFSGGASMVAFFKANQFGSQVINKIHHNNDVEPQYYYLNSPAPFNLQNKLTVGNGSTGQYTGYRSPSSAGQDVPYYWDDPAKYPPAVYSFVIPTSVSPGHYKDEYFNGRRISSATVEYYADNGDPLTIGYNTVWTDAAAHYADFTLGEMLLFGSTLSDASRTTLENSQTAYFVTYPADTAKNNTLSSLTVSAGTLSPVFTGSTTAYTDTVSNSTSSIRVTPTLANPYLQATLQVSVNGSAYTTQTNTLASATMALNTGSNTVKIKVSAKDGTQTIYTITVVKPPVTTNILNLAGLGASAPASPAYSLRRLSSTWTNGAIQVRRSSDNTTQEIGFTANGDLDTATLKAFVGSGNGYVYYWYDQSGFAFHAVQATLAAQPLIVNAGVIYRINGRPAIYFGTGYLTTSKVTMFTNGATMVGFAKGNSTTSSTLVSKAGTAAGGNTNYPAPFDFTNTDGLFYVGNAINSNLASINAKTTTRSDVSSAVPASVYSFVIPLAGTFTSYINGVQAGSQAVNTFEDDGNALTIGNRNDLGGSGNLWATEIVLFNAALSTANRNALEASQTAYYNNNNAALAALTVSPGALSPAFAGATATYNDTVGHGTTALTITATRADAFAGMQVSTTIGGTTTTTALANGVAASVPIDAGSSSTVKIIVTAQNPASTYTYTIKVTRLAVNTLDKAGLAASALPSPAYSLRRLSTAYTGKAISIRRSSDSTMQDIGFTANGDLDTAALKTFVGSGNGYVAAWYDQSGYLYNAAQAILSTQPRIVNAGVIDRLNGRPAIYFGTASLATVKATMFTAGASMVSFAKGNSSTPSALITKTGNAAGAGGNFPAPFDFTNTAGLLYVGNLANGGLAGIDAGKSIPRSDVSSAVPASVYSFTIPVTGTFTSYINGLQAGSQTVSSFADGGNALMIGNRNDGTSSGNLWAPEIVLFNAVLSTADRNTLEASQTAYYNNANSALSALTVSPAAVSPVFVSTTTAYTGTVPNRISSVTIMPTAADAGASLQVSINGGTFTTVASGATTAALPLNTGSNTIKVLVTAPNGTTSTYTITITRVSPNPLDQVGLNASAPALPAYSLRLLSSGYQGKAINVRRSSDSTTQDIGFTANGDLDTAALKTFAGSGNVYVVTWYDQSGNLLDATQPLLSLQPRIVNAGVVDRVNGKPAIYFGAASLLGTVKATLYTSGASMVGFAKGNSSNSSALVTKTGTPAGLNLNYAAPFDFTNSSGLFYVGNGNSTGLKSTDAGKTLLRSDVNIAVPASVYSFTIPVTGVFANYVNGTLVGNDYVNIFADGGNALIIGNRADSGSSGNFWVPEIVLFSSVLSNANRNTLEQSQVGYYGSTNNRLSSLTVSAGTLSPAFVSTATAYADTVGYGVSTITVTPTPAAAVASVQVRVNGGAYSTVASATASAALPLNAGSNTVDVLVTPQTGTTATYTITVTRLLPNKIINAGLTAATAFSLRLLSSTYTGNALNVRRSGDNATKDIGFTGNGDFDTATLKTFVGNGSGYVVTWYDQGGYGYNATQASTAVQPRIVNAGVIERINGSVAIYFGSANLTTANATMFTNGASMVGFAKGNSTTPSALITKKGTAGFTRLNIPAPFNFTDNTGVFAVGSASGNSSNNISPGAQAVVSSNVLPSVYSFVIPAAGTYYTYRNGVQTGSNAVSSFSDDGNALMIGRNADGTGSANFWTPEIVLFNTAMADSNRNALEKAQAAYYGNGNADLSSLFLSTGTLTPVFKPSVTSYSVAFPNSVSSFTVTPTLGAQTSTLQLSMNGGAYTSLASGTASAPLLLNTGINTVSLLVTAQNGTVKTYTVNALRMAVPPGNAVKLNGANQYVSVNTDTVTVINKFTVEAWVKPATTTGTMNIFSSRSNEQSFDFKIQDGHTIHGDIGTGSAWLNTGADAEFAYTAGRWSHIAYVVTGTRYTIYANGVQVGSDTIKGGVPLLFDAAHNVTIGSLTPTAELFNGSIDEVRVYKDALTQANIQADMQSTAISVPASLVFYYNFDQSAAPLTYNYTGIGYTGTVANNAVFEESYAMVVPVPKAATVVAASGFTANWGAPATGTIDNGYLLDVATDSSFTGFATGYNGKKVSGTSAVVSGLAAGTVYYYRVRADKTSVTGQGAPCGFVKATTLTINAAINAVTTAACKGTAPLAVVITASNGTAPYTFIYTINNGTPQTVITQTGTSSITVLTATAGLFTYVLKSVTDAGGATSATSPSVTITIKAPTTSTTAVTINQSALPYKWNGTSYTDAGKYLIHLTNAAGCDSAATLVLTVRGLTSSTTPVTVCASALPYNWNGTDYTAAGTYTKLLTTTAGGDSAATLILTVSQPTTSTTPVTVCSSALPYTWNGTDYAAAGSYTIHLTSAAGCDSVATLVLTIKQATASTTAVTTCSSALPYQWNGTGYNTPGSYTIHLTNAAGCDSAATLVLTVNEPTSSTTPVTICSSALPYTWNGVDYTAAGSYIIHLTNAAGCDSAATLVLTVSEPTSSTTTVAVCSSSLPYTWNGVDYTTAGSYTIHLTNVEGCDSAATLVLTVAQPTSSTTPVTICSSALPYTWNGVDYTAAGSYTIHLANAAGCDSAAMLVLTVNEPTNSTTPVTICSSALPYHWNAADYTVAGSYTIHLTNAAGCDSAATLVLTVSEPTSSTTPVTICSTALPYNWNGADYTAAGSYTIHLTNMAGCDSAATLVLTINQPTASITPVTICSSALPYNWNGTAYTAAGSYTIHLTNAAGCDSAATLVLSVTAAPSAATLISAGNKDSVCFGSKRTITAAATGGTRPYQYSLNGGAYQASGGFLVYPGDYKVTVMDANGCWINTNTKTITQPATKLTLTLQADTGTNSLAVNAAGGYGGYTYSYNSGPYYAGNIFTGINAGDSIKVSDAGGCTATARIKALAATLTTPKDSVCYGSARTITATATGGLAPFQYSLNGGAYQASRSFLVQAGSYTVTVMDATGAIVITNSLAIVQPAAKLAYTLQAGAGNTVIVNAAGGYGGYTYSYNSGPYQAGNVFTGIKGGDSIKVADAGGCTTTARIKTLAATLTTPKDSVCYGSARTITAIATGGLAPYQYSLNDGGYQTSRSFLVLAGSYTVTVMDATGATVTTGSLAVIQPAARLSIALTRVNISCSGASDGIVTATTTGGFGSYLYSIDSINYQATGRFSSLTAGTVKVYVKDAGGCTTNKTITVTQPATPCTSLSGSTGEPTSANAGLVTELKVNVRPNPTVTHFIITLQGGDSKKIAELRVMDMQGRSVYHTVGSVFDSYTFGQNFGSGIYIAEVLNGNKVVRIKLVKGN